MPVAGLVRLRRHLFGRQFDFGTAAAATRAYPFSGVPSVNLNWTDVEGDFGSLDPVAPPYRGAPEITASLSDPGLAYNNLPLQLSAIFGGGVTPVATGTSFSWEYEPSSLTQDDFDPFTYEFGDDVVTDWFQLRDGITTTWTVDSPEEGAGVLTTSMDWRFANAASTGSTDSPVTGSVPSIADRPDSDATPVYLKDCSIFIDSTPGGLGGTQLTDAVHNFSLSVTQEVDEKRFVNGTQSFELSGYSRGARTIELTLQYAKTADTVGTGSESDAWHSDTAVPRYVTVSFESTREADTGTPYSWLFSMPMRYYTREETNINGNTTVTLTGHAFYEDDTLDYAFYSEVVNTLGNDDLGEES